MTNQIQPNAEKETAYETVRGAVAGDDAPMETGHRFASAALVGATYPIVLVVLLLAGLVVAYFTSRPTDDVQAPSTSIPAADTAL